MIGSFNTGLTIFTSPDLSPTVYTLFALRNPSVINWGEPIQDGTFSTTPLRLLTLNAVLFGHTNPNYETAFLNVLRHVPSNQLNLNYVGFDSQTVVFDCIRMAHAGKIQFLTSILDTDQHSNLDFNIQDSNGNSPLSYAVTECPVNNGIALALILDKIDSSRLDFNIQDGLGKTILSHAILNLSDNSNFQLSQIFSKANKNNLNFNIPDQNNKTPLEYAVDKAIKGSPETLILILEEMDKGSLNFDYVIDIASGTTLRERIGQNRFECSIYQRLKYALNKHDVNIRTSVYGFRMIPGKNSRQASLSNTSQQSTNSIPVESNTLVPLDKIIEGFQQANEAEKVTSENEEALNALLFMKKQPIELPKQKNVQSDTKETDKQKNKRKAKPLRALQAN